MHTMRTISMVSSGALIAMLFLGIASYYDIRYRKIPAKFILSALAVSVCHMCLIHRQMLWIYIVGAAVGAIMLIIGRLTAEGIGYGDGMAFVITGFLLGGRDNVLLLCVSLMFSALYGVCLLVCRKGNRKTAVPFFPFMLTACIIIFLRQQTV